MTDQTFREIQLSGKQLVFAFMASVVVLVAAFLLGVSVGRGVRQTVPPGTDVVANDPPAPTTLPPPTETKPGDLTYHDKLQGQTPAKPGEQPAPPVTDPPANTAANGSKPVAPPPVSTAPPSSTAPPASAAPPPTANPAPNPVTTKKPETPAQPPQTVPAPQTAANTAKPPAAPPAKGGYVLQMGLYRSRENAQNQVADLKKSGYPATLTPRNGAYYVFVGPYSERAEAERMQARLLREKGTKPLISSR
jgi:cell division protein FtsN